MTAKEFLSRARRLQARIDQLERARQAAWERATSTTANGNTPVSGGDISRKTESYAELIATYDAELGELTSVQAEINKVIHQVQDHTLAMLLRSYYVEGKTWEQTACDIHYSYFRTVHDKHPAALRAVDAILQKSL